MSRVGRVAFEVGTGAFGVGTFLFLAGRASPLPGSVARVHLLDAIGSVRDIDVGGRVTYPSHRVATRAKRGYAVGVAGVHTDAGARDDLMPGLFAEISFLDYLALGLRQIVDARAKDGVEPTHVILGAPHGGRGRVVPAAVVPCEHGVQPTVGAGAGLTAR